MKSIINTMTFVLTNSLKDAFNLFLRVTAQNKGNEKYPEAVHIDGAAFSAANSTFSVRYFLTEEEKGLIPQLFDKPVLLPATALKILVDTPLNTEVSMVLDGNQLTIKKGKNKNKLTLAAMDSASFPKIGELEVEKIDKLSIGEFTTALKAVQHSVCSNATKPLYCGTHLITDGTKLSVFASDGFRLSLWKKDYESNPFQLSIPTVAINALLMALSKRDQDEHISVARAKGGRHAAFIIGANMVIRTVLLDGQLMDYNSVFGTAKNTVVFDKETVLTILKTISTLAKEDMGRVIININQETTSFTFHDTATSYEDSVTTAAPAGIKEIKIALNVRFLTEAIKAIPGEKFIFKYSSELSPVELTEEKESTHTNQHVIVPIRISSN